MKLAGKKVFIAEPLDNLEDTYAGLEEEGCRLIVGPPVSCPYKGYSEEELIEICRDVDGIIGMAREKYTRKVLSSAGKLKVICKYGVGVDSIDLEAATEKGILVTVTPVHFVTVAEHAFALMLAVMKKIVSSEKHLKSGGWRDQNVACFELYGKTVGLVGFGNISREVALRLSGWGVKIIVYDPYISQDAVEKAGVSLVDWETLFKLSDVLSIHMPLNSETSGIIGCREFSLMKDSSIIVNTSRGKIIDEEALIQALHDKKIGGAGLDVFSQEPVSLHNPLLKMENVVVTPHAAGWTFEALRRMAEQAAANCFTVLQGQDPKYVVNPKALKVMHG